MADTKRVLSDILALYADNTTQQIAPQDHRDFIVSALGSLYIRETSTGITLDGDDIVILATGGASGITITLPPMAAYKHKFYVIVKVDTGAGAVIIDGAGGDEINQSYTYELPNQWNSVGIVSIGSRWIVLFKIA
jgi:hypothetical protein